MLHRSCPSTRCFVLLFWSFAGLVQSFAPQRHVSQHAPHLILSCSAYIHTIRTRKYGSASSLHATTQSPKDELLNFLSTLETSIRLPCGLECDDSEREQISQMVSALEGDPNNLVASRRNGKIESKELLGDWNLLYTSSRTMIINKSLSGLGRSVSSLANFAGLRQTLTGSKFLGYIEFVEQIGSGPDALDVRVTGEWMLEPRTHPFTGQPCTAIRAELETITYGPSSNKANDWPSLGPIRLLDVLYLDDDLQITRVNVNTDSIFVYQRQRA